jgi:hypothetical protein
VGCGSATVFTHATCSMRVRRPRRRKFLSEKKLMGFARRQLLHLAAFAAALPAVSRFARAQTYPARPITLVVPYAAGGPTDVVARVLANRMRTSLGQPLLVENIAGAGGTIALSRVAPPTSNEGARPPRPSPASRRPRSTSDPPLDAGQRFNRPSSAHSRCRCPSHRLSAERSAPTNSP